MPLASDPGNLLPQDLVEIRLQTTDLFGTPITQVNQGDEFLLQAFVEDLRDVPLGVFSAYEIFANCSPFKKRR